MTKTNDPAKGDGRSVAVQEAFTPAPPSPHGTKSGSTEDLKALHADLTAAYREYLEMAKIKPSMLNSAMLGLIQQFLRHNEIAAEPPQAAEMNALEKRLEQRRKARENDNGEQKIVNLNQSSGA